MCLFFFNEKVVLPIPTLGVGVDGRGHVTTGERAGIQGSVVVTFRGYIGDEWGGGSYSLAR